MNVVPFQPKSKPIKHLLIQPKQVVQKFQVPARTAHFVRDADRLLRRVVEILAEVRFERRGMKTLGPQLLGWEKSLRSFVKRQMWSSDRPPLLRIYETLEWYRDHYDDDQFIPEVESARSLKEKFERLEGAMQKRVALKQANGEGMTVTQVLERNGIVSARLVDSMMRDVIIPAKRLRLTDATSDAMLAARLAELYAEVRRERDAANLTTNQRLFLGGPVGILGKYIDWLGEQDWTDMSTHVLKSVSPAFAKFRREMCRREGFDLIDGKQERSHG